jgi:hypothetical protein
VHEERYGYADRAHAIELVAIRTAEISAGPELELVPPEPLKVSGPAVLELDGSTCWIAPGWVGVRDGSNQSGGLLLTRA